VNNFRITLEVCSPRPEIAELFTILIVQRRRPAAEGQALTVGRSLQR
jgi:hypothetical protein